MPASKSKRATVYFDPAVHRALREKAEASSQSVSDVVDEAVRVLLAEDAEDLEALDARRDEPTVSLDDLTRDFQQRGLL